MRKSISIGLCLLVVGVGFIVDARHAGAACGINTEMGRSTLSFNIAQTDDYKMWFRIKPQNTTNNAVYALVDNVACYKIGDDSNLPANSWSWVQYGKTGAASSPTVHSFTTSGRHTVALIGNEPNVAVDKLLLIPASDSCIPDNIRSQDREPGDNCSSVTSVNTQTATGTIVGTTASGRPVQLTNKNGPVSGDVILDDQVLEEADKIVMVEYFVGELLVATANEPPFSLDTTLLADGEYQVRQKVYYKDGTTKEKVLSMTVNNVADEAAASRGTSSSFGEVILGIGLVFIIGGGVLTLALVSKPSLRKSIFSALKQVRIKTIR